jgi:hypothetical protein
LDSTGLTAVLSSFIRRLPRDGSEGALEERVVDNVALLVFSFDDPVAGVRVSTTAAGEEGSGSGALCGIYEKWSACAKGAQFSSPGGACYAVDVYISTALVKKV